MLWLKVALLAGLAEALVTTKLPNAKAVGSVTNVTITSGGLSRYYLISIPSTYNANVATPAILSYHGGTQTAEIQLQLDQLTNPEFNTNSIVIYPQGVDVCISNKQRCSYRWQLRLIQPRTNGKAFRQSL